MSHLSKDKADTFSGREVPKAICSYLCGWGRGHLKTGTLDMLLTELCRRKTD